VSPSIEGPIARPFNPSVSMIKFSSAEAREIGNGISEHPLVITDAIVFGDA
jgi:hypothetical protein